MEQQVNVKYDAWERENTYRMAGVLYVLYLIWCLLTWQAIYYAIGFWWAMFTYALGY